MRSRCLLALVGMLALVLIPGDDAYGQRGGRGGGVRGGGARVSGGGAVGPYGGAGGGYRSTGTVDVNAFARHFGGGGHAKAAGALVTGTLSEARDRVIAEARTFLAAAKAPAGAAAS